MVTFRRLIVGLLGPSREVNQEALKRSGRSSEAVVISEACVEDAAAIARVHVKVFRRAHLARGPSLRIREGQWVSKLRDPSAVTFCFVANLDPEGVVGFANGAASDHPGYQARLEKIYLLPRFQGLGVGRRLVCAVARRLHELGMKNMMLFSQAENPACRFSMRWAGIVCWVTMDSSTGPSVGLTWPS